MHQSDDPKPLSNNRRAPTENPFRSLAGLTGWENEIAFRIQCKKIIADSGLDGLYRGLDIIRACFSTALEVYEEETARALKEKFKK